MSNTNPKTWRDVLPVHPAVELFPLMNKDELRELATTSKRTAATSTRRSRFGTTRTEGLV